MADAIAITQCEHSSAGQLARAHTLANSQWPRRKWVQEAVNGELPITLLLNSGTHQSAAASIPNSHQPGALPPQLEGSFFDLPPAPGRPQVETGTSLGYTSLGLRWHPADLLDLDLFSAALAKLPAASRIKGVLHTPDGWQQLNRAGGTFQLAATAWRQDSRLEIILADDIPLDTQALIAQLKACLVKDTQTGFSHTLPA